MMGVGSELVAPNLCEGQELSGDVLNKVFTQRTVWLLPEENIINNSSDDNSSDVEDSVKVCFMFTMYFCLINALVSVACNLIFSV